MTDGFGVSAQSCTYGAWLKVHVKCTGIFSFATNVDDSCVLKRALIPSHNITIDPRSFLDLTIKLLQWGPEGWGPEGWGPEGWGGPKGGEGGPKISRFFVPLPPPFSFFLLSLRGPFVEFWWCF